MGLTKLTATPQDLEFVKAIHDSHGRANNSTISDLIYRHGCTADDVAMVAKKTHNDAYLKQQAQYSSSAYAKEREVNKFLYCRRQDKYNKTFRDYEWYFKNTPEKYKDLHFYDASLPATILTNRGNKWSDKDLSLYSHKYTTDVLTANYPSDFFVDRLKENEKLYDTLVRPYGLEDIHFSYDMSSIFIHEFGQYRKYDNYMRYFYYDYDRTDGDTKVTSVTQRRVLEQMVQVNILATVMLNEIYTPEELEKGEKDGRRIDSYADYIFSTHRKTGAPKHNHPQKVRLEMFAQTKALEMLLAMGLGLESRHTSSWDWSVSNKKLVKRIQTAYKTFIKAKTVDERKAMRELLKDQLGIIINDFMRHSFNVVELKCVEKQDEMFEKNSTKVVIKSTKAAPITKNQHFVRQSIDLSKLVGATTATVGKGRD